MPVSGISARDAQEYLRWLDQTGRVKGARLCSEREWERAARGADARIFPHGDVLKPGDANHDSTYGRLAAAFGPYEVCSYERSVSPFDACDMAGNLLELTTSSLRADELIIKGGGYYFFRVCERATNRETFLPAARSVHIGFRVCADANRLVDVSWRAEAGPTAESKLTSMGAKE